LEDSPDLLKANSVTTRPSRKAKTKEAVLKHLNRDVELLTEEKIEKKPSAKKAPTALPAAAKVEAGQSGSKCSSLISFSN